MNQSVTPTVEITIPPAADALMARLGDMVGLGQAIARGMDYENQLTVRLIKERISGPGVKQTKKKAGQYVGVDTGRLRQSINASEALVLAAASGSSSGLEVRSSVGSNVGHGGKSVEYALIHEVGGTIHRESHPTTVRLRTLSGGGLLRGKTGGAVFAKASHKRARSVKAKVPAHDINIPARPYVEPSILERLPNYSATVGTNIVNFLSNK